MARVRDARNDASGFPCRGHATSRRRHGPRGRHARVMQGPCKGQGWGRAGAARPGRTARRGACMCVNGLRGRVIHLHRDPLALRARNTSAVGCHQTLRPVRCSTLSNASCRMSCSCVYSAAHLSCQRDSTRRPLSPADPSSTRCLQSRQSACARLRVARRRSRLLPRGLLEWMPLFTSVCRRQRAPCSDCASGDGRRHVHSPLL